MTNSYPIGLFDSGIGGLSVWKEIIERLPHEATIYFADSARCPYGPRPVEEVRTISAEITRFLLVQGCKLIVVACNTASAAALESLRAEFDVPFIGLEPALKPAAEVTQTGHIGILATAGTLQGTLFQTTRQRYARDIRVHIQVGHHLVEQIEAGQFDTPATERLLRQYLEPMLAAGVDHIVLGCTHYPLILPLIQHVVDGRATVIDPAQAVARQVARILATHAALPAGIPPGPETKMPRHTFYTSGQLQPLTALATAFSPKEVQVIQVTRPSKEHPKKICFKFQV